MDYYLELLVMLMVLWPLTSYRSSLINRSGYLGETITALKLNKLINTNGGNTTPYLRKNIVTHVICTNLAGTKVQQILDLKKTSRIQIVKPEWILDSIAQGKKLSTSNYHVMDQKVHANTLGFKPK